MYLHVFFNMTFEHNYLLQVGHKHKEVKCDMSWQFKLFFFFGQILHNLADTVKKHQNRSPSHRKYSKTVPNDNWEQKTCLQ